MAIIKVSNMMCGKCVQRIEKALNEAGDKITEEDKAPVLAAIEKLRETVKTDNTDAIKADTEALEKAFYALSEKLYAQSGAAQGGAGFDPNAGAGASSDGTYYSADYEDKSDN